MVVPGSRLLEYHYGRSQGTGGVGFCVGRMKAKRRPSEKTEKEMGDILFLRPNFHSNVLEDTKKKGNQKGFLATQDIGGCRVRVKSGENPVSKER